MVATQHHLATEAGARILADGGNAITGADDERGGASRRYLPKEAWDQLSEEEKRETDAAKARGSAEGKQFVPNTPAAAEAGREVREQHEQHEQ